MSAVTIVEQVCAAFGTADAARSIDACCAAGPDVIAALFIALLAPSGVGPDERDGRAVFEDEELCLSRLAAAYPEQFLAQLDAHPKIATRATVVGALAQIPGPDAEQRLLAALRHRRGWNRWIALRGLLARDSEAVAPQLAKLLRDRDSTVAFTALDGLRRWGRPADVPALLVYTETAAPGGVEFALDAIESICARAGQPLPPGHPGPRLTSLRVPAVRAELRIVVASQVAEHELLGQVDGAPLRSPCAGVVAAIDHRDGRLEITIRRPQR